MTRRLRPPRWLDEAGLAALLLSSGVDTAAWGTCEAKTIGHLLAELRDGDCELIEDQTGLARRVRNVWVDLHAAIDTERLRLVERRQVFADGRVRERTLPASLGEKCKIGEDPADAARRGVAEELGIAAPLRLVATPPRDNPATARSYPGLRTIYDTYWFAGELDAADFVVDGYVDVQSDKTTYFEWER